MSFTKFPKIENILKTYVAGYVPFGEYSVTVKMDGANAGIVKTSNGLFLHSRNTPLGTLVSKDTDLSSWNTLKGFAVFVRDRYDWFNDLLDDGDHVFMEWLIPHTITYPNEMYRKVYIFDEKFDKLVNKDLGIERVPVLPNFRVGVTEDLLADLTLHSLEYLQQVDNLHKTEGLVLKYLGGDVTSDSIRFKMVFPEFKEDNRNKFSHKSFTNSVEINLAGKYPVRSYDKILDKAKTIKNVDSLSKQHIPVVLGLAWHDYMTEFFGEAVKDAHYPTVNTKALKSEFERRIRDVFVTEIDTGIRPVWFE